MCVFEWHIRVWGLGKGEKEKKREKTLGETRQLVAKEKKTSKRVRKTETSRAKPPGIELEVDGQQMTVCVEVRDSESEWRKGKENMRFSC